MIACEIIAETKVDWPKYLSLARQVLGRSISQGVDRNNRPIDTLADFVCTLDELEWERSDPIYSLSESTDKLEHLSFTVLIVAPETVIFTLIRRSSLKLINVPSTISILVQLAVVSGTLAQWKEAITNNSTRDTDSWMLSLMNKIVNQFDSKGLSAVFSKYERKDLGDNSFLLLPRVK